MMKKKALITTVALATLTLTGCHRHANRVDYMTNDSNYSYTARSSDDNGGYKSISRNNNDAQYNPTQNNNRLATDPHYDFVNQLGFTNINNTTGDSYYRKYRLDSRNAADQDIFHGWRHTWVEPNDYIDEEIDVYRYTADYNGQSRTIHILSHRGNPIGGYHFGDGETAEHARMVDRDGYTSRIANDFRNTWDDIFNIRH